MESTNSIGARFIEWLDSRYQTNTFVQALLHVEIPRSVRTYYLGGITLFFFFVQVITGILLTIYYRPTPEAAYSSILLIMNGVRFGWLIRSIHSWSATLMVLFCILHLLRVYFQAAYKKPREVTWILGVLLLLLTMGFGFTGYLLPWDQRAYWATTVGSQIAGAIPVVGEALLRFLRGGVDITALTLTRFFGIHILILPLSLGAVLLGHLILVHQTGLADPDRDAALLEKQAMTTGDEFQEAQPRRSLLPFFPHYVVDELAAWYLMLAALVILASVLPAGLEDPADPLLTPEHAKPEWYFLFLYQALKYVPRIVGITLPFLGIALLLALPLFDRNPYASPRRRPIAILVGVVAVIVIIVFTIWGGLS
jgi:quinol-cytochrome oxidoreductase complex cytochrome b subunit